MLYPKLNVSSDYEKDIKIGRDSLFYLSIIMISIWSIVFLLQIYSTCECLIYRNNKGMDFDLRLRLLLMASFICVIAVGSIIFTLEIIPDGEISILTCSIYGGLISSILCFYTQAIYWFFSIKASLVKGFIQSETYKKVFL